MNFRLYFSNKKHISVYSQTTFLYKGFCTITSDNEQKAPKKARKVSYEDRKSHKSQMKKFFQENPNVEAFRQHIPDKYLALKRVTPPENLYLIDINIAKKVAEYVVSDLKKSSNGNQIICETNAGLGLITSELLDRDIKLVRLYESCPEFRSYLKAKLDRYKGRVELFTKDIFLLHRYEYIDKQDHGNRVERFFTGVPNIKWDDDPIMRIIGSLPNMNFIRYLIKSLILQSYITTIGRIQFYTFMRPRDFIVLTAGPHLNLHTYQRISVIFNLFFDCELIEKFSRKMFLPWQSAKSMQTGRYPGQIDTELIYFTKINYKKAMPVTPDNLLSFYSFVQQFFGKGKNRIIPTVEKWVPGSGLNIMLPTLQHENYFENINIFTEFGQLTPQEILSVYKEFTEHPGFERTHFLSLFESQLMKAETVESNIEAHLSEKSEIDASL